MEVLCIIPARSGSKGIHNKNIVQLVGKPLIAYTIEAAINSKLITRTIVSTDSEEYALVARNYGAEVPFLRPTEFASDKVHAVYPVIDCLERLMITEKYFPEIVIMLLPTSPLRQPKHIDDSIRLYLQKGNGSVVSITNANHPRYIKKIINGLLYPYEKFDGTPNFQRQELEKVYEGNGSIFVTSVKTLLEHRTFHVEKVYPYVMEKRYSIDINDQYDLEIAEYFLKKGMSNEQ